MTKTPFAHTNTSLAIALHIAGVPCIRIQNLYSPETLARIGCTDPLEALRAKRLGRVVYYHHHVDNIAELVQAFNDQAEAEENTEIETDIPAADVVRLVCHTLKARKEFTDAMWNPGLAYITGEEIKLPADYVKWLETEARAWAKIKAAKERNFTGDISEILTIEEFQAIDVGKAGKSFAIPGFKMVKATAPKQTRDHIGL